MFVVAAAGEARPVMQGNRAKVLPITSLRL